MTRLLAVLMFAALLAAPPSAPAQGAMPTPDCHGINVTDKAGDSAGGVGAPQPGSPSSDLVAGWITYTPGADKALANIQVDHLTEREIDPPYMAIGWEFGFTTSAGPRFVRAYHDLTGTTKYTWGEPRAITDDQTQPRAQGATTGTLFPGKNGVIQIELPLKDLGAAPGSQLKALALEVRQWISLPAAVPSTGLPLFSPAPIYDEAAGRGAYTLGPCAGAPAAGAPGGPPPPPPVNTPQTGSTGQATPTLGVKVTVPKLSAKKLKRSKRFTIKLRGKATALQAVVRKRATGGKALASGKLAKLNGSGKLTLKGKKLKKGRYVLMLTGKNAQGQPAEGAVRITIKK